MLTSIGIRYYHRLSPPVQALVKRKHFIVGLYYCASLLLSILYLQMPLFATPHESQFFLYASGVSYGELYQPGLIPKSLPRMVHTITQQHKAPPGLLQAGNAQPFVPPGNVVQYSPLSLLPEVLGTGVGFLFDVSPVNMVYFARASAMLTDLLAGTLILYLLPCFRWQVMLCMLLPSSFVLRSGEYADPMFNTASFLFFALLVRLLWSNRRIRWWHFLAFGALSFGIAVSKVVYFPLCFTTLLLRRKNFSGRRQRICFHGFVIGIGIAGVVFWIPQASATHYHVSLVTLLQSFYDPAQQRAVEVSTNSFLLEKNNLGNAYLHFLAVTHHPFLIVQKFIRTLEEKNFISAAAFNFFFWNFDRQPSVVRHVGATLHWLSPFFFLPFLFNQRGEPAHGVAAFPLLPSQRWILAAAMAAAIYLGAVALYIDYTGLYSPVINNIQGRYLVALMPYFCLMASVRKFRRPRLGERQAVFIAASLVYMHYAALALMWKWMI